jgi:hypothetical protein
VDRRLRAVDQHRTPRAWASRTTSFTGTTVPSVFDMGDRHQLRPVGQQLRTVDEKLPCVDRRPLMPHHDARQKCHGTMLSDAP